MTTPAIIITSIVLVGWLTLATIKYQYLKIAHKAYVAGLAEAFNDIEDEPLKRALADDVQIRRLLIEGFSINNMELPEYINEKKD